TRRQQVEYGLLPLDDKCVPGIVATLEAGNHGSLLRQQVNDLALAFIAPLRSQHNNTSTHLHSSLLENLLKISGIAAGLCPSCHPTRAIPTTILSASSHPRAVSCGHIPVPSASLR